MNSKNALCYFNSAKKLGFNVEPDDVLDGFTLRLGKKNYYFCGALPPLNDSSSNHIAENKYLANALLSKAGLPVPKAVFIQASELNDDIIKEKIAMLSFPLVVKPQKGSLGKGVLCNIKQVDQLKRYLVENRLSTDFFLIEEFHGHLNSYRVLISNKKIIGLVQRYPAHVVGDGYRTVEQLIQWTNDQRIKIHDFLGPIVIDDECLARLDEVKINLSYVPQPHEKIRLGYVSNATRGGTYKPLPLKTLCRANRQMLIRAASVLNLNLVGFDLECEDPGQPIEGSRGVIIEANIRPSLRIHEHPMEGKPVIVSKKILRYFIYKHPFNYLYSVYKNKGLTVYLRGLILASSLVITYLSMVVNRSLVS